MLESSQMEISEEQNGSEGFGSELSVPRWSVISFEKLEDSGLTYFEALSKLNELYGDRIPGLCIVTDEAAARIDK